MVVDSLASSFERLHRRCLAPYISPDHHVPRRPHKVCQVPVRGHDVMSICSPRTVDSLVETMTQEYTADPECHVVLQSYVSESADVDQLMAIAVSLQQHNHATGCRRKKTEIP